MALNPNAKVPVIVDHDAPGGVSCTVFEIPGAILLYLAEKTGKLGQRTSLLATTSYSGWWFR